MAAIETNNFIGDVPLQNFLLFIFVIVISIIFGNIIKILIVRLLKNKLQPAVYKSIARLSMYLVCMVGFYLAFQKILNFDVPAFLAALGILGVTFLLTMLPVMQNIFAGVVLSLERSFKEKDIVEYEGVVCLVKDIGLRKTTLRSIDGKLIIVSNIKFISGEIINYSKGEFIRVELNINIKFERNYNKAIEAINKVLHEDPNVLPRVPKKELSFIEKFFVMPKNIEMLEPKVFVMEVDKDKIKLRVWFWIWDILRKESIISNFYESLMQEFKANKISFG